VLIQDLLLALVLAAVVAVSAIAATSSPPSVPV
jgi:hypothetical protein